MKRLRLQRFTGSSETPGSLWKARTGLIFRTRLQVQMTDIQAVSGSSDEKTQFFQRPRRRSPMHTWSLRRPHGMICRAARIRSRAFMAPVVIKIRSSRTSALHGGSFPRANRLWPAFSGMPRLALSTSFEVSLPVTDEVAERIISLPCIRAWMRASAAASRSGPEAVYDADRRYRRHPCV